MKLAFHAPMKHPGHPVPSGDREIARLTLRALERAGCEPVIRSTLRTLDLAGSAAAQADLVARAEAEADRLIATLTPDPPDVWLTYHCHYKAPDLVGPAVTAALGVPYLVSEPSISPRRRRGPWARFARASEHAIAKADRLFWTTARDLPELLRAGHGAKLTHLPAFLDPGPAVEPRPAQTPLRLLAVGMMRPGAKLESYRRLAAALRCLETGPNADPAPDWRLTVIGDATGAGEKPAPNPRREVEEMFGAHPGRVRFLGALSREEVRARCARHDLLVWPGVEEGVGMVWLEAQAAGLPVVAEDGPAARAALGAEDGLPPGGRLAPPGDPAAMAEAIRAAASMRAELSRTARAHIEARHTLDAAAATLRREIRALASKKPASRTPACRRSAR